MIFSDAKKFKDIYLHSIEVLICNYSSCLMMSFNLGFDPSFS